MSVLPDPSGPRPRRRSGAPVAALAALAALALSGCTLIVTQWDQYQGEPGNAGFRLVRTELARTADWRTDVGPALFGAPVVGADGRMYVPQLGEGLLALDADGDPLWLAALSDVGEHQIMSTPVVDPTDNNVFVTVTDYGENVTRLHRVSASGQESWSLELPGPTTSSPKLWRNNVFLAAPGHLFVLETAGFLVADVPLPELCPIVGGSPFLEFLEKLGDIFTDIPIEFDTSAPAGPVPPNDLYPTLALVDADNRGDPDRPLLVVSTYCDVQFLEWTGAGVDLLGRARSDDRLRYTSPSVSPGGLVVVGSDDGVLGLGFDVDEQPGVSLLWTFDPGEPVPFTPATSLRQVFIATESRLIVLDSDGTQLAEVEPSSPMTTQPAVSAGHVFFGTEGGLQSASWDLATVAIDDDVVPWLYRAPAIRADGSVLLGERGSLLAYPAPS